jgi:hypothetical protein
MIRLSDVFTSPAADDFSIRLIFNFHCRLRSRCREMPKMLISIDLLPSVPLPIVKRKVISALVLFNRLEKEFESNLVFISSSKQKALEDGAMKWKENAITLCVD